MKEFEKWIKENLCMIPGRANTLERKYDIGLGWEAALKWVLNHPYLVVHSLDFVKEELSEQ